jgi:tetratricopeptide (TPR) repeat protein
MNFSRHLHQYTTSPQYATQRPETLAEWAVVKARKKDPFEGLGLAYAARHRAIAEKNPRGEMHALNASAMCHMMGGDDISAVGAAIDAFNLAQKLGNHRGMAHAITTVVGGTMSSTLFPNTVETLRTIIEFSVAERDMDLQIRARSASGLALTEFQMYEQADLEIGRALSLAAQKCPQSFSLSRILLNRALLYWKKKSTLAASGLIEQGESAQKVATDIADEVHQLAVDEDNPPIVAFSMSLAGMLARENGNYQLAVTMLQSALNTARRCHLFGRIPFILVELASAHKQLDDNGAFAGNMGIALNEANAIKPSQCVAKICEQLSKFATDSRSADEVEFWTRRATAEKEEFEAARLQMQRQVEKMQLAALTLIPAQREPDHIAA